MPWGLWWPYVKILRSYVIPGLALVLCSPSHCARRLLGGSERCQLIMFSSHFLKVWSSDSLHTLLQFCFLPPNCFHLTMILTTDFLGLTLHWTLAPKTSYLFILDKSDSTTPMPKRMKTKENKPKCLDERRDPLSCYWFCACQTQKHSTGLHGK